MTADAAGAPHRSLPPGDPDVLAAFGAALTKLGPFEKAPRLAVAVSGGADSLALVFLAAEWCRAHNGEVIALTVDHKLRDESATEAAQVAAWMATYGIAHHILAWEGPKPTTGIQDAARQARYRLLTSWCHRQNIFHLLLGHHADDQAETVVFRNNRHSGPDGLAGMAALVELPQLRLLRPLLNLRHATLRHDLQQRGHDFLNDPSNNNPRFTRARLRKNLNETARLDAITLAHESGASRILSENQTASILAARATVDPHGFVTLDVADLESIDDASLMQILRRLALCVGTQGYPPRTERLQSLLAWLRQGLANPSASRQCTLGGCCWKLRNPQKVIQLMVCREPGACAPALTVSVPFSHTAVARPVLWDARFQMEMSLFCSGGDGPIIIDALGRQSPFLPKNLPEEATSHLPALVRDTLPVIKDSSGILAIPHLGYLRANTAIYRRLGSDPARILKETAQFRPQHPLAPTSFCFLRPN